MGFCYLSECIGGLQFLGDPARVSVSFGSGTWFHLHPGTPLEWHDGNLDAAVLQLHTSEQLPPPLGHVWGNVDDSTTLHLISHDKSPQIKGALDLSCPVVKFSELTPGFRQQNPDLVDDPRRTLLRSSFLHGSSGSPGFNGHGRLVVMYTTGYPTDDVRQGRPSTVEQAVNIAAIREQLASDNPQLAAELFPVGGAHVGEPMDVD